MYHMKNIITHDEEIILPTCMYFIKNPNVFIKKEDKDDTNINISNQGNNTKMTELEQRQDQLLKKLDILYDRIKTISSYSKVSSPETAKKTKSERCLAEPEEVVLVLSPESLPWYLHILLKETSLAVNVSWHIHSSVSNEKVQKIKNFIMRLDQYNNINSKVNLRLIFKNVSADTELKLSSLALPIVGNVNILRYLSFIYQTVIVYDPSDHVSDNLLDICHLLERTPEKNKEALVNKLFAQYKDWINGNHFSIVDLAAYNLIKQWKNTPKYVPKVWFDNCEKLCLL